MMAKPQRISVQANLDKPQALPVVRKAVERLRAAGVEVLLKRDLAEALGDRPHEDGFLDDTELLLCLGGDGTLLNAVRSLEGREVPVLGVNLGGLGFLTAVPDDEIDLCLEAVLAGSYRLEDRPLIMARVREKDGPEVVLHALNDMVIDEGTFNRRAVVLKMTIDGAYVGTFTADGLVVATPTGSTAYSLSAGGPIVHPALPALVVTPMCAHSLSIRPLVFGDREAVEVENLLSGVELKITADGQDARVVAPGTPIRIGISERRVRLAFLGRRPYYEILRTKLNWGGIPKNR
jgi:NAD+ kinase